MSNTTFTKDASHSAGYFMEIQNTKKVYFSRSYILATGAENYFA